MADKKKKDQISDTGRKGWWARSRESMKNVWSFAREHSTQTTGAIGKLYYLSLASGWGLLAAEIAGVPGAAQGSIASFGTAKGLKFMWDQARDIKDAAEDLIEEERGNDTDSRLNVTDQKIMELQALVEEQQSVIREQMASSQSLQDSHETLTKTLAESQQKIQELQESHGNVTKSLHSVLATRQQRSDTKAAYRNRYSSELDEAVRTGQVSKVPFDKETDTLVRFEEEDEELLLEEDSDPSRLH